eukprot:gnl/TRDRNA2_/TRDRNA2_175979_c1_seq15.p1 gnl/TRDRNA2_/TRDRNA2_175979_c1~~gnl/TRDRNA2_/TRDRNA2_175979_c1_seq15.p1  ORF type:complete len:195 (+),score=41.14 gnl/TRDRNA2_/TRDRNA2_175979_c1_seq15:60-644(+)
MSSLDATSLPTAIPETAVVHIVVKNLAGGNVFGPQSVPLSTTVAELKHLICTTSLELPESSRAEGQSQGHGLVKLLLEERELSDDEIVSVDGPNDIASPISLTLLRQEALSQEEMLDFLIKQVRMHKGKVLSREKAKKVLCEVIGQAKASVVSFSIGERDAAWKALKAKMDTNDGYNAGFVDPTQDYGIPTGMM